jgi:hypothetical protein
MDRYGGAGARMDRHGGGASRIFVMFGMELEWIIWRGWS